MSSRLDLHEELCKILGSRNVYYNPPESVKMKYPAIVYSLNEYDNKSANSGVYLQWTGYNLTLIDKDPDSPIATKLSVLQGCRLSRPPYPADGLYHFPFNLKTTGSDATKVFDEYYQKGYDDCYELTKDGYENGYAAGQQAEYDRFWDSFQQNGNRTNYHYAFWANGAGWNEVTFKPKHNLRCVGQTNSLFRDLKGITSLPALLNTQGITLDLSGATYFNDSFYGSGFKEIGILDLSNCGQFNFCFYGASVETVHIILGTKGTTSMSSAFNNTYRLKNITFDGVIGTTIQLQYSPLTVESMKSVILHLKDYSGTSNEFKYSVKFSSACWEALEADSTAPDGGTWNEYVFKLGWNT